MSATYVYRAFCLSFAGTLALPQRGKAALGKKPRSPNRFASQIG